MSDAILTERDGAVGRILLNRPERLNAFSGTMREDLATALAALDADPVIRAIIITGVGRAFSTGGDITVMRELVEGTDTERFDGLVRAGAEIVRVIDEMHTPVIAAINGPAAGAGACLALACDLRIVSESASIGFGFLRVGLHPDWGGSFYLPRLVGPALAMEFILTGGMISAERGERLGLFNRVVAPAELEPAARALAGQIAAAPENVVAAARHSLRHSLDMTLPEMLEREVEVQREAFQSPNFREGINSFLEKRAPRFHHRRRGPGSSRA